MDFGVAVFTGFRGGHLNNLAGAVLKMCQSLPLKAHLVVYYLDHNESSFAESRALHGEGLGRTGVGGSEVVLFISHCVVEILGRLTGKIKTRPWR